ncbi:MAG: nucleoside kinase [Peptococcaceae bacterium]|jgi:uridine kinase|nr:nucleoside kinase [Peptococcaceae bacterium]
MTIKLTVGYWTEKERTATTAPAGARLLDLARDWGQGRNLPIIGALYNNEVVDLYAPARAPGEVYWLDMSSEHGLRIYKQSVIMLLGQATRELFPHWRLEVHHALGEHSYCELNGTTKPSSRTLELIEERMNQLVAENEAIVPHDLPAAEAVALLEKAGYEETAALLRGVAGERIRVYSMGEQIFHSFYALAPDTGCLRVFRLEQYEKGFLLRYPSPEAPERVAALTEMPKLAGVLRESKDWTKILNVYNVSGLCQTVKKGPVAVRELIHVSEALQEKYLVNLAAQIHEDRDRLRVVLIAGPSSSGKTTFCYRLAIQLRVLGLRPVTLSTDDYFVNREETPLNPDGSYDYESMRAINVDLFNSDLRQLIAGEDTALPTFDFKRGLRLDKSRSLRLEPGHPVIIEGIHALNEALTPAIGRGMKFKVYISSMVQIDIDSYNRVATSDARLLRRVVRDSQYRGRSAEATLRQWPAVRRGEEQNIFPFQEDADTIFNTALLYETGVFKKYAEPLLRQVRPDIAEYADAQRLLTLLAYFPGIDDRDVPLNSVLREFIGGGSIHDE